MVQKTITTWLKEIEKAVLIKETNHKIRYKFKFMMKIDRGLMLNCETPFIYKIKRKGKIKWKLGQLFIQVKKKHRNKFNRLKKMDQKISLITVIFEEVKVLKWRKEEIIYKIQMIIMNIFT